MSETKNAQDRLLRRLKAIPEGEIGATARRAGLPPRHLRRLREGKSTDIRLSTLERLAAGLMEPLGWVIDDGLPPPPPKPEKAIDLRPVKRLLRDVKKLAANAEAVVALLPDQE